MAVCTAPVKEVIQRTPRVKSIRLEVEEPPAFQAGQFLSVWLRDEPEFKRYLSISSSPTETGHIEFTKKITNSAFSLLLNQLRPGDKLKIEYPFGRFLLPQGCRKAAFLSGGIGITPIRSIARYAIDKSMDLDMVLIYGNCAASDIVFREDLEEMQKASPNLKIVHVLSQVSPEFKCVFGMIDAVVIREHIPDYIERKFFVCGPPAMVESMTGILSDKLKLPAENIVTENFKGY